VAQVHDEPTVPASDLGAALRLRKRLEIQPNCKLPRRLIQLASKEAVAKAGIDKVQVAAGLMEETMEGHGELMLDPTAIATRASAVPGTVLRVYKAVGDWVRKGEVLALVD